VEKVRGHYTLRLAAITCEALLRFEAVTLSDFGVSFDVSCGEDHGVRLDAVGGFGGYSLPQST